MEIFFDPDFDVQHVARNLVKHHVKALQERDENYQRAVRAENGEQS